MQLSGALQLSPTLIAMTADLAGTPVLPGLLNRFQRDNSSGDGDDPESKQHHHPRQQATKHDLWHEIAVTNGGHGHDGPIHALTNGLKLDVGMTALDQHQQITQHHLRHHYKKQKHASTARTGPQCTDQHLRLIDESQQLEHAQHRGELEDPKNQAAADLRLEKIRTTERSISPYKLRA